MGDLELKTTTRYRERVASYGSAAYGNGRIDNRNEKERDMRKLTVKFHSGYSFKHSRSNTCCKNIPKKYGY